MSESSENRPAERPIEGLPEEASGGISDASADATPSRSAEQAIDNSPKPQASLVLAEPHVATGAPLAMVETAFLASTASLIWLVNYYFPMGPLLRIFFPVPIALTYLRWGHRAAWMSALVSGLLLSVLMGPTRSILFFIPFGLLGVQLGALWRRRANWFISISIGTIIGTFGFFFRIWLVSLLLGDDLWAYVTTQITELVEWGFVKLGLLIQPELALVQAIAAVMIVINNIVYLFVVHLAAWLLLERLGNPIPAPPKWVQVILDYEVD